MGIQGLTKLLADQAPECMTEQKFDNYFGRKIAVDASMHIYQFMVVVGRVGDQLLTNEAGDITSHLQGMFYRTARMLESGLRPVFVFDGKPPELKRKQLEQRLGRRDDATEALKAAQEAGNQEEIEKYSKRTIKVTREHNDECKRLLRLMGVPVVDAASEAEAQCASMAKAGLVYGVATEDMDALTFGCPRLVRHLMAPATSTQSITEFDCEKALAGLKLTHDQFIDFCILCGCDYATTIKGIGPVRALQLIQKHGSMKAILDSLDPTKYPIPEDWPWEDAHKFFANPDVVPPEDIPALKWSDPDEDGLVQFLVTEKNFSEDRVRKTVAKIKATKGKAQQGRIENFFKPSGVVSSSKSASSSGPSSGKKDDGKRKDGPAAALDGSRTTGRKRTTPTTPTVPSTAPPSVAGAASPPEPQTSDQASTAAVASPSTSSPNSATGAVAKPRRGRTRRTPAATNMAGASTSPVDTTATSLDISLSSPAQPSDTAQVVIKPKRGRPRKAAAATSPSPSAGMHLPSVVRSIRAAQPVLAMRPRCPGLLSTRIW